MLRFNNSIQKLIHYQKMLTGPEDHFYAYLHFINESRQTHFKNIIRIPHCTVENNYEISLPILTELCIQMKTCMNAFDASMRDVHNDLFRGEGGGRAITFLTFQEGGWGRGGSFPLGESLPGIHRFNFPGSGFLLSS